MRSENGKHTCVSPLHLGKEQSHSPSEVSWVTLFDCGPLLLLTPQVTASLDCHGPLLLLSLYLYNRHASLNSTSCGSACFCSSCTGGTPPGLCLLSVFMHRRDPTGILPSLPFPSPLCLWGSPRSMQVAVASSLSCLFRIYVCTAIC